ncbi:FAD binding domain-containing protein [Mycobacterium sp. ML1]
MSTWVYHRPSSIGEAVRLLSATGGLVLAGGQTLIPALSRDPGSSVDLVDLDAVTSLRSIAVVDGRLHVGAMATHTQINSSILVRQSIPSLAWMTTEIADPQVRNRATIGGSLALNDPAGDYPAVCVGLDATIVTDRRRIPAQEFFRGPFTTALADSEIVVSLTFPVPRKSAYVRLPDRRAHSALVGVLVAQSDSGFRVAISGLASGVTRWQEAEEMLARKLRADSLRDITWQAAGTDPYRAHLVKTLTARAAQFLQS